MRYFIPATRLLPPRIPHEVRRPRVRNLLFSRWQESPAVILAAPAGYGKSALLAPLAEVWVTLGEEARDPAVFVWHLLAAYRDRIPGKTVEARLMGGDWPGAARALAEALTTLPPHTLVLDEAHKAPAREGLSIIKALLNTPGLRLGLAGRRAAPWEALASVIGPEALAFDLEEALALARALAPSMAAFDVERAWRLVSGWPLGLRVLLRCAARGMLPERAVFEPPEPESISAYLLAGLEPEMATLAARAAAFTEVGPEEAERLGFEFEALETLAEDLLLERVGQRLRFHPLVRSALLRTLPPEEARSLVIRAAKHKGGIEAAVHLIEAGRYHEAAERLKAEGTRWLEQGLNHSVLYLTDRLTGHADLTLLRAEALRQAGRYADAEVLFLEAAQQGQAEAHFGLARLYLDTVEPAKAWPHLRAARDLFPWENVRPLWAENALNAGRIGEALKLGAQGPRALLRSGRVELALAAVREMDETPPPDPRKTTGKDAFCWPYSRRSPAMPKPGSRQPSTPGPGARNSVAPSWWPWPRPGGGTRFWPCRAGTMPGPPTARPSPFPREDRPGSPSKPSPGLAASATTGPSRKPSAWRRRAAMPGSERSSQQWRPTPGCARAKATPSPFPRAKILSSTHWLGRTLGSPGTSVSSSATPFS